FRADSALNLAVTTVAEDGRERRVGFVDAQKAIAEASDFRIAGGDLFYEHVHLNPEGNYRLAVALADAVVPWLPKEIVAKGRSAWPDAASTGEQLGLSDWNRYAMLEDIARRLNEVPYTRQFNHAAQRRRITEQMAELRPRLHPREVADARERFEAAVKRRPDRAWIHQNFAEFLEMAGDTEAALAEWTTLARLIPHHYLPPYQSGRLLARLKRFDDASERLGAALRIRPDLDEAHLDLGQILAAQKKWAEALGEYAVFQNRRPDDPRVQVRKADVLAAQGRRPEAIQCLRDAIALRPTYWEPRYLLGVELGLDGKFAEAEPEFREVVRLNPEHTLARFNWAVALAKQARYAEAIREFEEVLRRNPGNSQARQYLDALRASAAGPPAK
ncbi:MAG: tetratricopeptide repeat protein, partial [Verrucomicrobiota bacterium]